MEPMKRSFASDCAWELKVTLPKVESDSDKPLLDGLLLSPSILRKAKLVESQMGRHNDDEEGDYSVVDAKERNGQCKLMRESFFGAACRQFFAFARGIPA